MSKKNLLDIVNDMSEDPQPWEVARIHRALYNEYMGASRLEAPEDPEEEQARS